VSDGTSPPEPRRNPDLLGHESAERQFLAAWQAGRVPHAWLITGPEGIGKATLAYRIARFVLSGGGEQGGAGLFGSAPPPEETLLRIEPGHPVFRRVASGGHADLMSLERSFAGTDDDDKDPRDRKRKTVIGIDEVREAGAFLRLTPAEGGWRVLIVDSADEMNPNAANGILKMLEEPPKRALILLISHAPSRLLPTIRSRCCALRLAPLADDTVATLIGRYRADIAAEDAAGLVRLGEGSVGRALALAEEGALDLYRDIVALLTQLPRPDTAALHAFGDRLGRQGAESAFRTAGALIAWWIGRMIRDGAAGLDTPPVVPEEAGCAARLLAASGVDRWLEVWDKITRLLDQTDRLHLDRKQVVLNVFAELGSAARA
jgi:DNA polymerase III subunit delta'